MSIVATIRNLKLELTYLYLGWGKPPPSRYFQGYALKIRALPPRVLARYFIVYLSDEHFMHHLSIY